MFSIFMTYLDPNTTYSFKTERLDNLVFDSELMAEIYIDHLPEHYDRDNLEIRFLDK